MKQRLLSVFAMLSLMISGVMAQTFTISTDCEGYFIAGDRVEVSIDIEGAQEMTALQFNFSLPEGFTLSEGWPIYMGNATNGHAMNASILDSGDLFVVLYSLHSGTFDDGTLISFNVTAAEDAVSTQGKLYNVRTATTDAVSHTLSDVTFAMNIASEEPEPTWHLSGPATEEEITTQSYIDGLVYNQTTKPRTITLKKGYNVIIIPSSWTTPTFAAVSDFSKRYTPFTSNDLGITNPSNKTVLVLYSQTENTTCYVKWGTNVVPEPEPEPEPETKYYWYAGTTDPTTMTSIDPIIPADAASYVYGWTEITEAPTEIRVFKESSNWQETGLFPEVQWYIAFPAEFSLGMVGGGWTKSQTVINGVLYDIWTCGTLVDTANSQFIKLETPDYTPDPETKCYWYVGTTDPRTMTNIDPIIPADAASYVYGWTEITETPTMIDVRKESSNWEETGLFPDVQWYIACPSAYGFNTTSYLYPVGGWYVIRNAVTIGGIEYDIWKCQTLTSVVFTQLAKVGEPVSKPEPEPTPEPEGLSTSKYYRVKNVTTGLYLQVEGNNTNMKLQNKAEGLAMMQIFGLEDAGEEKYYIKAADADNRYYAHASGWDFNATTNADSKTPFTIALVEGEEGVYTLHQSVSEYQGLAGADNSEAGSPIYCNKGIDNNGKWAFEALTAEEQAAYVAALRPITSLDELSNSKAYYVKQPQRAGGTSWAVETGAETLKSNADLGVGASCKDNRQHFAFLTNNEGATYYLYHVAEAKFVNKDGSLSENPADAVSFTDGKYANTFVVYFDTDHYINVGGSSQMVIDDWNTPDEGNSCELIPVADFDATEALKLIEALETGVEKTTDNSQQTTVIYDLMGRRVEKAEKGIYIVNGKKVIVK